MSIFLWEVLQTVAFNLAKILLPLTKSAKTLRFFRSRELADFRAALAATKRQFELRDAQIQKPLRKIWVHVSSAGELEQAIPPIRKLVEENLASVFLTWFSPSTEPFLKNAPFVSGVAAFPLDLRSNHRLVLDILQISDVVLVRYDFWPALFSVARAQRVAIHLLAATRAASRSNIFSRAGAVAKSAFLRNLNSVFAATQADCEYFQSLSLSADIIYSGDPKWSRAKERAVGLKQSAPKNLWFLNWAKLMCGQRTLVVLGSPHSEEHRVAAKLLLHRKDFFIIYVPHDCAELHLKPIIRELEATGPLLRFSNLYQESLPQSADVIVIDRVGFLAEVYSIADIAIVGGGFDGQIHNVLEPAAHPVCTLFGINIRKAREAQALFEAKAAKCFATPEELCEFVLKTAADSSDSARKECSQVQTNAGVVFSKIPNTNEIIFQHFQNLWTPR